MTPDTGGGGKVDFGKTLFSPPVIIGGITVGAVILLMNAHSASASANQSAPTADPAVLNATVAMNNTAAQQQVQLAQIAAQSGAATQASNVQSQGQVLSYLTSLAQNNGQVQQTFLTTQAGITNAQIAASTSIALDNNNNMNRLQMGYIQAGISADQAQAQVNIATIQANAAKSIAKTNAISGIFGGAMKLAAAPFTGGASLLNFGTTPGSGPGVFSSVAQSSVPF